MRATVQYIEEKFREFNAQMFQGKLPPIPIQLSRAKTYLGACTYKKRRKLFGKTEYYDFKLRISTFLDLSQEELDDTIIHEMIHYHIAVNHLQDTSIHGQLFCQIMQEINERHGRHITISHKTTKEEREQALDQAPRWRAVAVVAFHDGRTGIKVLPYTVRHIESYKSAVTRSPEVKRVDVYLTKNPYFGRFPKSSTLKVHILPPATVAENIRGAQPFA